MRIGVVYPQVELRGDPRSQRAFARGIEDLGSDHLVFYDHVVGAVGEHRNPPLTGPYRETDPFHDPLVASAHVVALTDRLEFCSEVMVLPQRQTVLVARQAADVSLVCGGRFSLGVGAGWNPVEYEALGMDFQSRGDRLTEQIDLLRRQRSGEVIDYHGRYHRVDRAALVPTPASRIPILCGGLSTAAYRRAAELADGFIFTGPVDDMAVPGCREVRELLAKHGRSVETFRADLDVVGPEFGGLGLSDVLRTLDTWGSHGGTHASVKTMGIGLTTVEEHLRHLQKVAEALGRAQPNRPIGL